MKALLARLLGLALIGVVIATVPWKDRVLDTKGALHKGQVIRGSGGVVLLRTAEGDVTLQVAHASDVQEGLFTTFRHLGNRPQWALLGLLLHFASVVVTILRWGVLLRGADLATPTHTLLQLGWVGFFFGAVLPGGLAGGDVVKSVYVARTHPGKKARAVLTVIADRVTGMFALCLIAAGALLVHPDAGALGSARIVLLLLPALGLIALVLLFFPGVRARSGLPRLLDHLPFQGVVRELREAGALYGARPGPLLLATVVAFVCHALVLAAFACYANALGFQLSLLALGAAIPLAQMLTSIPGLPGGWGVGDFAFLFLLPPAGVAAGPAVALSFSYRLLHTVLALPGGLFLAGARRAGETLSGNGDS